MRRTDWQEKELQTEIATLRARVEELEAQVAVAKRAEIGKIISPAEREVIEAAIEYATMFPTHFRPVVDAVAALLKERQP